MKIRHWTPFNIFEALNHEVTTRGGSKLKVTMPTRDGWDVGGWDNLTAEQACDLLNEMGATFELDVREAS